MMAVDNPLPGNLARLRKARDLSQEQLAAAASLGVDTVARIEQGRRSARRPGTLQRLAAALDVPVERLTVTDHRPLPEPTDTALLRHAITADGLIPEIGDPDDADGSVPGDDPARRVRSAWLAYLEGRHPVLVRALPSILADARLVVRHSTGDRRAEAARVLSGAYRIAAGLAGRLRLHDLAWSAAERAVAAARESDDPDLETAASLRYVTWVLVRQGRFPEAERLAVTAAERVQPGVLDSDRVRAGVFGNLLFNASTAAQSRGSTDRAEDLLAEA